MSFNNKARRAESGGNDRARNPRSSAEGRYQFTDDTWTETYLKVYGGKETDAQILSKKLDVRYQERLMQRLTADNRAALRKAGISTDDGNTYLAHFAGAGGAINLHRADPNASAESVLGRKVIKANPHLANMTAKDVISWANGYISGKPFKATRRPSARTAAGPVEPYKGKELDTPYENLWTTAPEDIFNREPKDLGPVTPKLSKKQRSFLTLTEGKGLAPIAKPTGAIVDETPMLEAALRKEQGWKDEQTFGDRFSAAVSEVQLIPELIRTLDEDHGEYDKKFMQHFRNNWKTELEFANGQEEADELLEATSFESLETIKGRITERRERNRIIDSNGTGTAFRLGAGVLDPAGLALGLGIGKIAQMGRVGSQALAAGGRYGAAVASASAEGAIGNIAFEGILDGAGGYKTSKDYFMAGITGAAIGLIASPLSIRAGREDAAVGEINDLLNRRDAYVDQLETKAQQDLGPDASREEIDDAVAQQFQKEYQETLKVALGDVPEDQRLMISGEQLTADPVVKDQQVKDNDLGGVADSTMRNLIAEVQARSNKIVAQNPINNKYLSSFIEKLGMESPAMRMLKSNNSVIKAAGLMLLENPSGAGGRRVSASIIQATRERVYKQEFLGYGDLADQFRKMEGKGKVDDFINGTSINEFNRRVYAEMEQRQGTPDSTTFDSNPFVIKAADMTETLFNKMRMDQQAAEVIGAARLGDKSRGYVPHRIDPAKLIEYREANGGNLEPIRDVLAEQFVHISGFDAKFSKELAAKYIERGLGKATGNYHVPMNLYSAEAADMVRDAFKALGVTGDDLEKAMGKWSRGGANHTKQRLKLNLMQDIGQNKKLMDLFVTDVPYLVQSYSRRVSGEVALAKFGVFGTKGFDVIRKAAEASGADVKDLKSLDQIAAEFLNTPIGEANYKWLDNLRSVTSSARLGGMGFTQAAETGNAITAIGLRSAMKSVKDMPKHIKHIQAIARGENVVDPMLKSLDRVHGSSGIDGYTMSRHFDIRDNQIEMYSSENMDVVTRAIRGAGDQMVKLSMQRMIHAGQVRGMSQMILEKSIRYAREGKNDVALRDMGFSDELLEAFRKDLDNVATFEKGSPVEVDLFRAKYMTPQQQREILSNIERGANQIIQKAFIGETGAWAHNGFLRLLFQFRTFPIVAMEKQLQRNLNMGGVPRAAASIMVSAGFALPIHLARIQSKTLGMSSAAREEYIDKNMNEAALVKATLQYAASAGLLTDIMDIGVGLYAPWGGETGKALSESMNVRSGASKQFVGGVVMPSAGWVQDVWNVPHTGDWEKGVRALPGGNHPVTIGFLNALSDEE